MNLKMLVLILAGGGSDILLCGKINLKGALRKVCKFIVKM